MTARKYKNQENIKRAVMQFSDEVEDAVPPHDPESREEQKYVVSNDRKSNHDENLALTADAVIRMTQKLSSKSRRKKRLLNINPLTVTERDILLDTVQRCIEWAHDPARLEAPGAEQMSNDQVWEDVNGPVAPVLDCLWVPEHRMYMNVFVYSLDIVSHHCSSNHQHSVTSLLIKSSI